MPIYEYSCQECGARFDARRAMKDADAPIACPVCGAAKAKRGLSLFFASSSGGAIKEASGGSGCASCSSSSCASCRGH
ncbi:MAG TPA: zinc ribbon domain-containing protein [Anaerolineae bacterium]|nr:zinc ribbon domain-containing protein [Anaerolineae bacterium]HQI87014.1 zinc ribbon domain-containing protein [Anaerolineae bacterium]